MKVDSLDGLRSAFEEWRRSKKHAREAMPEELLARARRAMERHGMRAVVGWASGIHPYDVTEFREPIDRIGL
jgi:hypothetical protein